MSNQEVIDTIQKAVERMGSKESLAGLLGVSSQSVALWLKGERCPSADKYVEIIKITKKKTKKKMAKIENNNSEVNDSKKIK